MEIFSRIFVKLFFQNFKSFDEKLLCRNFDRKGNWHLNSSCGEDRNMKKSGIDENVERSFICGQIQGNSRGWLRTAGCCTACGAQCTQRTLSESQGTQVSHDCRKSFLGSISLTVHWPATAFGTGESPFWCLPLHQGH